MIGLIPRAAFENIRSRLKKAMQAGANRCRISVHVKRLEAVKLTLDDGSKTTVGRRLLLGVKVRESLKPSVRRAQVIREELEGFIREAERIKDAATQTATA